MTALRVARGLGGRVAVIDTERGSASLYSGENGLDFDVLELESYEVEKLHRRRSEAEAAGYDAHHRQPEPRLVWQRRHP
jgi:hypothetical protein